MVSLSENDVRTFAVEVLAFNQGFGMRAGLRAAVRPAVCD